MADEEISFQFTGNPPEIFKRMLFTLIKETMKNIKKEVLKNEGFIQLDYMDEKEFSLRAVSINPETTIKMTVILQSILTKFRRN